jgi:hypothetical protein
LILEDLTGLRKMLILLVLREKQGKRGGSNSNLKAMYTQHYSTVLDPRQWGRSRITDEPSSGSSEAGYGGE